MYNNKKKIETYRDIGIWQKSVDLADKLYDITNTFPDNEKHGLVSQIQKAIISIATNTAEGWGRHSTREFIRYLYIAHGSTVELETLLIISKKRALVSEEKCNKLLKETTSISKMINGMIKSLKRRIEFS